MSVIGLIVYLIIGALAGWMAEKLFTGDGTGLISNIVLGVVGAGFARLLFEFIGIAPHGFIGSMLLASAGAVVLLAMIKVIGDEQVHHKRGY